MPDHFINYAHRGASAYNPENTMLSFAEGVKMGANGIETDVRRTKDGVLVLFHDSTLLRTTGEQGGISDYTLEELKRFTVKKEGKEDKIPTLEEFLSVYAPTNLTLAIELKQQGIAIEVMQTLEKYRLVSHCVITSFHLEYLEEVRRQYPAYRTGWLKGDFTSEEEQSALQLGLYELCPQAANVTSHRVEHWHEMGFHVRAWGVADEELMFRVFKAGADGMTVNFPDKLAALCGKKTPGV